MLSRMLSLRRVFRCDGIGDPVFDSDGASKRQSTINGLLP
jgi:hypothetical protein